MPDKATVSSRLLGLASELISNVLSFLKPHDLVAFGQTCKKASDFVSPQTTSLWRSAFLHVFDDPRDVWSALLPAAREANAVCERDWDWFCQLRKRMAATREIRIKYQVERENYPQRQDYNAIVDALLDIFDTAAVKIPSLATLPQSSYGSTAPQPSSFTRKESLNMERLRNALCRSQHTEKFIHDFHPDIDSPYYKPYIQSSWPGRPMTRSKAQTFDVYDAASRLHVYYGLTARERSSRQAIGAARALVYDWFLIGPDTDYGPFQRHGNGLINWNILEAVCTVIRLNFELVADGRVQVPDGLFRAAPGIFQCQPSHPEDWARVSGSWLGTYSFLDYSDLFHFNIGYRPGPRPTLDGHLEACGDLMRLELVLDDELRTDRRLQTKLPICKDLPPLFFSGTSRGHGSHRAVIEVRGSAALVPGAREVRWRFLIR